MQDISQIVHKIVLGWGCLPNPYCLDKHEACECDGKICIACFTACASHVLPLDVFSFQTQHPQLFTIEWQRKLHVHAFIIVVIHVIHHCCITSHHMQQLHVHYVAGGKKPVWKQSGWGPRGRRWRKRTPMQSPTGYCQEYRPQAAVTTKGKNCSTPTVCRRGVGIHSPPPPTFSGSTFWAAEFFWQGNPGEKNVSKKNVVSKNKSNPSTSMPQKHLQTLTHLDPFIYAECNWSYQNKLHP